MYHSHNTLIYSIGSTERNAPFGIPGVKDETNPDGEFFCILYQDNYITGYDHFLEIPTFVSFTIDDRVRNFLLQAFINLFSAKFIRGQHTFFLNKYYGHIARLVRNTNWQRL